jgi:hypothetical protein
MIEGRSIWQAYKRRKGAKNKGWGRFFKPVAGKRSKRDQAEKCEAEK